MLKERIAGYDAGIECEKRKIDKIANDIDVVIGVSLQASHAKLRIAEKTSDFHLGRHCIRKEVNR